MVNYREVKLDNLKTYKINRTKEFNGTEKRYIWTINNVDKMLKDGRPVTIVIPERTLSKEELEEYRKFFCSYAKKVRCNMVYFEGPIIISEINPRDIIP